MNDMIANAWLHNFKPCMADLFLERGTHALVAVCLGGVFSTLLVVNILPGFCTPHEPEHLQIECVE